MLSGFPVEAQAPTKNNLISKDASINLSLFELTKSNPWSNIKGFRSSLFGMNEQSVYRAIATDFKMDKNKVIKEENLPEKTTSLSISVPNLFSIGGTASIGYILGYKSKKLIEVSILWGYGATENVVWEELFSMANYLRVHFMKKQYKKKGLVANGK
jgi:hypothetical protein